MKHENKGRHIRYAFDSVADMARYIEGTPATWQQKASRVTNRGDDWDSGASYAKAWDMARYGWPEGARRAQVALKVLRTKTPAPDTKTDFYGHRPHVARFCAGAPDSMVRHAPALSDKTGAVVTLYVSVNANCGTRADYMANYGIALAQYINQMQRDGVRVEVWGVHANVMKSARVSYTFRVKRADQPLDLAVLAYAVGHPTMFRRLGFALLERSEVPDQPGYGVSEDATLADAMNPPRGAYVLNGMVNANAIAKTPEGALKYISEQIDKAMKGTKPCK